MLNNMEFIIEHCRKDCPKAARSWDELEKNIDSSLKEIDLAKILKQKFKAISYHHIPKIGLAGCPNGCSRPQIKDFAVLGCVKPQITEKTCVQCQACVETCLEKAINLSDDGIYINESRCISCGDCLRVCPTGTLTRGESRWELRLGGRVGRHPRFAAYVGDAKEDKDVVEWIVSTLQRYAVKGLPEERLSYFLERLG